MAKKDIGSGFSLPLSTIILYANYILKTIHTSNRGVLTDLRELLTMIDPGKNFSVEQVRERNSYFFLKQLLDARLKGYENRDILMEAALNGLDVKNIFPLRKLEEPLGSNELAFIEQNIGNNRNSFYTQSIMSTMYTQYSDFAIANETEKFKILKDVQKQIVDVNRKIKENVCVSSVSESLSLSNDEQFEATVAHMYNRAIDGSTKLKTGIQAINRSLNGGFENDRCYIYLGLPGEGKSSTLLNLTLQIKGNNKDIVTKDPTKRPTILFLTMENTLNETLERVFSILVSDDDISEFGGHKEIMQLLRQNGLGVSNDSPIDIEFRYVPSNSVDTDYLYTIYDEMSANGQEVVCLVQDYIKRIRPRDFKLMGGDMRIALGAVVDEFKEFAVAKHIPVITASQLNRDAAKIIDEGRKSSEADLVRKVGRANIGESTLITENADSAFILVPEDGADGRKYLGMANAKKRFKTQSSQFFYLPYSKERPLELLQDIHLAEPLSKLSLNELKTATNENNNGSWSALLGNEKSKPVEIKESDSIKKKSDAYGISKEFIKELEECYEADPYNRGANFDDTKIVLKTGLRMFNEFNDAEKLYTYTQFGVTPPESFRGAANVVRDFNMDDLEDGTPRIVYRDALLYNDEEDLSGYTPALIDDAISWTWNK
jgi:dnaB-like helicase C terminal domain|nr:MAG TPA: DNA polymerase B Like Replicative Helicase [Caudoviricetes sp.]